MDLDAIEKRASVVPPEAVWAAVYEMGTGEYHWALKIPGENRVLFLESVLLDHWSSKADFLAKPFPRFVIHAAADIRSLIAGMKALELELAEAADILNEFAAHGDCSCGEHGTDTAAAAGIICEVCEAGRFVSRPRIRTLLEKFWTPEKGARE